MKVCAYCGRQNDDEATYCYECGTQGFKAPPGQPRPSDGSEQPPKLPPQSPPAPRWQFRTLTPEEMRQDLVTLVSCRTLIEADMIVTQLEGAGITAFLPDQYLVQTVSWNLNTYGFVRVQVAPKDYEAAKTLLLALPEETPPADHP